MKSNKQLELVTVPHSFNNQELGKFCADNTAEPWEFLENTGASYLFFRPGSPHIVFNINANDIVFNINANNSIFELEISPAHWRPELEQALRDGIDEVLVSESKRGVKHKYAFVRNYDNENIQSSLAKLGFGDISNSNEYKKLDLLEYGYDKVTTIEADNTSMAIHPNLRTLVSSQFRSLYDPNLSDEANNDEPNKRALLLEEAMNDDSSTLGNTSEISDTN
jgi:hypothetical protein